jgi:type I restriction enzyme R subunit
LYLDKPLKAHTLMQTIARANRVSEGKSNGLIVDYIGIVKALRKALADYTANVGRGEGVDPTVDKDELINRILEVIAKTKEFLSGKGFELDTLVEAVDFEKMWYLQEAANLVCGSMEDKKTFSTYASELNRLMKYADRDDITGTDRKEYEAIAAIFAQLKKKRKSTNITDLMVRVSCIIGEYVQIEDMKTEVHDAPAKRFDISAIDFDLLRREFARVQHKNLMMKDLEEIILQKLDGLIFSNPNRIDYYERYQKIIDDYNKEQDRATIEKTFMDLMAVVKDLSDEEQRYVREGFTDDEELTLFDLLLRDDLSKQDIKKLKEVAASLLQKIKTLISQFDHWTDKQATKSAVDNLIRDTLWAELPECYDEVSISKYRQKVYEYVYMRYKDIA